MSDRRVTRTTPPEPPVPTGWELLTLVRAAGFRMLRQRQHGTHERYLEERDAYITLLEIAEKDSICAPILIREVQTVLDEESRAGGLRPRLDKP